MSDIRLDVAERNAQCDTCPARNFGPEPVTTIYTLYIGAGYRMPAFVCPDCRAKVAAVLGVEIRGGECSCVGGSWCAQHGTVSDK